MEHWIVAPIVIPSIVAPAIIFFVRHDLMLSRVVSVTGTVTVLAVAIMLAFAAAANPPEMYALGNWPAPFGIVLVLDRLSALMVLLTALLALVVLLYVSNGWDRRGRHFHALFHFQLMGINGAFLTGDIFNLFVFFEVLLIASYGLMLHGVGAERLRAGVHYVVVNLAGSVLFLIAVGLIYGVTGTLNMADLAVKVPVVPAGDQALLQCGAVLLLIVFAIKAALVPIHFWLPGTYAAAPAPVAALFAIMTKVGAYSIIRVYTLVFGEDAGQAAGVAQPWLMPAALATLLLGTIGVLAARSLARMIAFAVIWSMGTLLIAVSVFTPAALSAALYYIAHSTLAGAALFLTVDLIAERRGRVGDAITPAPRFGNIELLSGMFFLAALAMVGMPPLSGFIGKLLILDGVRGTEATWWIWTAILATSLLAIVAFARTGSRLFWKSAALGGTPSAAPHGPIALPAAAMTALILMMMALTVFAGPINAYFDGTAAQLFDSSGYIRAVLGAETAMAR